MSFTFNARYALLTYSQCGSLDPWRVSDHISELRGECIVAREAHADGGTHLHAFVDFGKRRCLRRPDVFDVDGYHPNVSATHSTPQAGFDYASKDGDIVAGGLERPAAGTATTRENHWPHIVAATNREEFYERLMEHAPRDLCTSFTSISKYADWRYRTDPTPYRTPEGISFAMEHFPELLSWAQEYVGRDVGTSCTSH